MSHENQPSAGPQGVLSPHDLAMMRHRLDNLRFAKEHMPELMTAALQREMECLQAMLEPVKARFMN